MEPQSADEVLSPFPEDSTKQESKLAERLSTLEGSTIGLFSNSKRNSEYFLEGVGEELRDRHDLIVDEVVYKSIATSPAEDDLIEDLREYDAVLIAYGDCGSCSSWTVHDAIQLEMENIPTVVYCSDDFTALAQYEAESQGRPGLPIVEFEHPIAPLSPDEISEERVTDDIYEATRFSLTGSRSEIREYFTNRYISDDDSDEKPDFGACTI